MSEKEQKRNKRKATSAVWMLCSSCAAGLIVYIAFRFYTLWAVFASVWVFFFIFFASPSRRFSVWAQIHRGGDTRHNANNLLIKIAAVNCEWNEYKQRNKILLDWELCSSVYIHSTAFFGVAVAITVFGIVVVVGVFCCFFIRFSGSRERCHNL